MTKLSRFASRSVNDLGNISFTGELMKKAIVISLVALLLNSTNVFAQTSAPRNGKRLHRNLRC